METGLTAEIIPIIVNKAIKNYKIDTETATVIVMETIENHPKFMQLVKQGLSLKEILKTRVYNDVEKKARRKIYYELRQYQKDIKNRESLVTALSTASGPAYENIITQLVQSHVSTNERLNNLDIFYRELFKYIGISGQPISIVDIGCGLHPLIFPFAKKENSIRHYTALDKDKTCISILEAFSSTLDKNIMFPFHWHIKDGWLKMQEKIGIPRFDVAFLMKIVPAISRVQRDLLPILLETPAENWIISGSKSSMTKYVDIEKRERKIISQFIALSGKQIIGEFAIDNEFCFIVK